MMIRRIRRHLGAWGLVSGAVIFERGSSMGALFHFATNAESETIEPLTELASAHYVRRMARITPGATCRHEAAALSLWLAWSGHNPEIIAGVRRNDEVEAHAWVRCGEWSFGEDPGQDYEPFARWIADRV